MRHFDALIAAVTPEMRKRSTQEWVAMLDAAGVPVSPVLHVGEMHKDPQAIARGIIAEVTHSVLGPVKTLGNWSAGQIYAHIAVPMNAAIDEIKFSPP